MTLGSPLVMLIILMVITAGVFIVAVGPRRSKGVESVGHGGGNVRRALRSAAAGVLAAIGALGAFMVAFLVVILANPDFFGWLCFLCERDECGWAEKNSGIGNFVVSGAFQAVVIGGVLGVFLLARRVMRSEDSRRPGTSRVALKRNAAYWAFGVAGIALVDLAIYIVNWVRWAHCRVDEYGEPFRFPTGQVLVGSLVALGIAAGATILGLFLRRRARSDRTGSAAS